MFTRLPDIPLIVFSPQEMLLPGISLLLSFERQEDMSSFVEDNGINSKEPFLFLAMRHPGSRKEAPGDTFQTGVVVSLEINYKDLLIRLQGLYRGEIIKIIKRFNKPPLVQLKQVSDQNYDWYFIKPNEALTIDLGVITNLLSELVEEYKKISNSDADIIKKLRGIIQDLKTIDFFDKDSVEILMSQIAAQVPDIFVQEKQDFIDSVNVAERIHLAVDLLSEKISILSNSRKSIALGKKRLNGSRGDMPVAIMVRPSPDDGTEPDDDLISGAPEDIVKRWRRYKKINKDSLHNDAKKAFTDDFSNLKSSQPGHHEWTGILNHLDFILDLYSTSTTPQETDITKVEKTLGESHYGLEDIKQRIYNFLGTKIRNPRGKGPIICFVGPPGVGKTSIGKSIAKSLNREFIRISLGGLKDEAEIRGHRRTYVGALPGRILAEIRRCGAKNPVFMLDEVDKLTNDFRGDPSSALLEVLDPEQNHSFQDHYVGAPFDLSDVLFLCTANLDSKIQRALLDRMSIINVSGYTEEEKIEIARRFLIPDLVKEVALSQDNTQIEWQGSLDEVVSYIVSGYTKEAGVRKLKQKIQQILESLGRKYMKAETKPNSILITTDVVGEILKMPQYTRERISATAAGEAIGLAWTEFGGETIYVHAQWTIRSQGDKSLSQTGSSGDVMFKSNKTALTVAKNLAEKFNPKALKKFETHMLHLQANDASTPTDGPSATITMAMAIYSELIGKPIKPFIALSGELTPKGKILAVGGIKEKVLAANRDGIKELVLPKNNQRNVVEGVPEAIQRTIQFHYVNYAEEVIPIAFPESTPAQDP